MIQLTASVTLADSDTSACLRKIAVLLLIALFSDACSGGSGAGSSSPSSPTSPTAAVAGCGGSTVPQVRVSFQSFDGLGLQIQMYGETFNHPTLAESLVVTRALSPCDYEITGQMLGRSLSVSFGRTSPFTNRAQGVERGSVVIVEGPGTFGGNDAGCQVRFNSVGGNNGGPPPGPFNIRIRFRVSNTNAIDNTGGCGDAAPVATPAPPPAPAPGPAPTTAAFNGSYFGSATGTGSFRIEPVVTGAVITGVLRTPPEEPLQGTIPLTGTVSASGDVFLTATDLCGGAVYRLIGAITISATGGATMAGTWTEDAAAGCRGATSGTFTATRQ